MYPKIIDNQRRKLLDIFENFSGKFDEISIASGYWDLKGMSIVLPYIKNYKKIRILIGKEPLIPRYSKNEIEINFPDDDFFYDLQHLNPTEELQKTALEIKRLIDEEILEVKVYRKSFLHAKCYIFGNFESENAIGIIGSSNFTENGLLNNTELNSLESDPRTVLYKPQTENQEVGHLFWFNNLWNDASSEEWTGKFIEIIDKSTHGESLFSPYEMYIHSLYQIYKDELDIEIKITSDSEDLLHAFQIRNAELLLRKLNKNGLAMLADSVGLGKTITAGSVVKKYIFELGIKKPRVEIVVPSSLKTQWTEELSSHFKLLEGIDSFNITSFHNKDEVDKRKQLDKHRSVDLFVIDEAHNLRNDSSEKYNQLIEWIKNNPECHVLLLTATPINNQLSDFAKQINLAAGGREDLFYIQIPKIGNQQQTIKEHYDAIRDLDSEIKKNNERNLQLDKNKISLIMRPILQHFMVRSTRIGIEKEFGGVLNNEGKLIKFPKAISKEERYKFNSKDNYFDVELDQEQKILLEKILKKSFESIIDNKQISTHPIDFIEELADDNQESSRNSVYKIFLLTSFLGLPIYRTTLYKHEFTKKSIDQISKLLSSKTAKDKAEVKLQMTIHNMMRILFLKRSESSLYSLKKSLLNYLERINKFEEILNLKNKIIKISDLNEYYEMISEEVSYTTGTEKINEIDADEKIYNINQLKEDISKDKFILNIIFKILDNLIDDDQKLKHTLKLVEKLDEANQKVLLFSYFADTVEFLEKELPNKTTFIKSTNSAFTNRKTKNEIENFANRFSPISKKYELKPNETELQFLISTDVLSEGQNLQDCAVLINYDLHWNPVRMIQRNGRINRLGSKHDEVFIYNLCPADEIEEYLKLENRLKNKIEIIKHSIGTDASILGEDANAIEFNEDEKILNLTKKIYEDNIDINEVIKEYEEETDILATEDNFINDLRQFHNIASEEDKIKIYTKIPKGKFGYLPLKEKTNSNFEVLVHTTIKISSKEKIQEMPIFVGLPKSGQTIVYVDKLEALNHLQTSSNSVAKEKSTFEDVNKNMIKENLDKRLLQIAEQAFVLPSYNIKNTQSLILEIMEKKGFNTKNIYKVLMEHRNRNDRSYITRRLRNLYDYYKDSNDLSLEIVNDLITKSEKLTKSIVSLVDSKPKIIEEPEIYSYHVKQ